MWPDESEARDTPGGPLAGVRVVELGQYIAAPYAAKLLADLGADVIKIEAPDGDPMRRWEGRGLDSPQFQAYNRGKRSVVLDLKQAGDLQRLFALAGAADVLIENYRPGVAERLGFGPDQLSVVNPRLIVCSITGFGPTGPYANRPSYDTVVSAVGAMYSQIVPAPSRRPVGPAFSDLLAGSAAAQAILAALHGRQRDQVGEHVEVSMVGALVDFLTEASSTYLQTGHVAAPDSRPRRAQAYGCVGSDGKAFVVHLSVPEKFWLGLLDVLERPELAGDERFASREARVANYDALEELLNSITRAKPRQHWLERLADRDIPHGPLNTVADLFDDPQLQSMGLVVDVAEPDGGVRRVPAPSVRFGRSGRPTIRLAPALGAHNDLVPTPEAPAPEKGTPTP